MRLQFLSTTVRLMRVILTTFTVTTSFLYSTSFADDPVQINVGNLGRSKRTVELRTIDPLPTNETSTSALSPNAQSSMGLEIQIPIESESPTDAASQE